jgi:hypothetical protein
MYPYKYKVSFRVFHPTINPEKISIQLALQPKISWCVGDVRKTPKGVCLGSKYESSYWCYEIDNRNDISLIEILQGFTQRLECHQDFLANLRSTGGRLEYFVGWFNEINSGEVFDYTLLSKIANLQIDL